jgi:hypothetical protein
VRWPRAVRRRSSCRYARWLRFPSGRRQFQRWARCSDRAWRPDPGCAESRRRICSRSAGLTARAAERKGEGTAEGFRACRIAHTDAEGSRRIRGEN